MENNANINEQIKNYTYNFAVAGKNLMAAIPQTLLEDKKINKSFMSFKGEFESIYSNLELISKMINDIDKRKKVERYIKREHRRFKKFSKHLEKLDKILSKKEESNDIIQKLTRLKEINHYIDRTLTSYLIANKDTEYMEEAQKLEPL